MLSFEERRKIAASPRMLAAAQRVVDSTAKARTEKRGPFSDDPKEIARWARTLAMQAVETGK